MEKEVLYILLPQFAAHEIVFLSQPLRSDEMGKKKKPLYINKVVAASMEPVESIGGFRILPDYTFETIPEDYAALILIGGYGWDSTTAEKTLPIIEVSIAKSVPVGAICNAASFMARHGFLNNIKHTGNGLEQLKLWGGSNYTNESGYVNAQAVSDHHIVTANGSASLEFAREMLLLLENDTPERIEMYYQFNKHGFVNE